MKKLSLTMLSLLFLFAISCNETEEAKKGDNENVKIETPANEAVVFNTVDDMIADAKTKITEIDASKLKELIDSEETFLLIDIRTAEEFNKGNIKNAVNIPRGVLEFRIQKESFWEDASVYMPKKDELIILSCKSGKRAALGALTLKLLGYTNVKNLKGGYKKFKMLYPEAVQLPEGVSASDNSEEEEDGGC